jgi:hypothetical protein
MSVVTAHKSDVESDVNNKIVITAVDPAEGPDSSYTSYLIGTSVLKFQTKDRPGLTNEALLAIVEHRLAGFQDGPCNCPENDAALYGVRSALRALKDRTARRAAAGLEGKMAEDVKADTKARIRMEGAVLMVGSLGFQPEALKSWGNWSPLTDAVMRMDPPATAHEVSVIEDAAAHLGGGARNGLTEFKSALASLSKPKK